MQNDACRHASVWAMSAWVQDVQSCDQSLGVESIALSLVSCQSNLAYVLGREAILHPH